MVELSGRRTRQRLLEAAIPLIERNGLNGTLLLDAARDCETPLDRARVFFRRDEDLVLALYARLAFDLESRVEELPENATVAERFDAIMRIRFDQLLPWRRVFRALAAIQLKRDHELGVLAVPTELIRSRVLRVFTTLVLGASDRPTSAGACDTLARGLYLAHLVLLLVFTRDTTDGQGRSERLLARTARALRGSAPIGAAFGSALRSAGFLFRSLVEPAPRRQDTVLATTILKLVFRRRRLSPGAGVCADEPCARCLVLHLPRVVRAVAAREPVRMVLPGFPAKSPSPEKTLGPLPDKAEELALASLDGLCREIRDVYPPGAEITVCSDGHVFADLVGVPDDTVTAYGRALSQLLNEMAIASIGTFSMGDLFEAASWETMREQLNRHYAEPRERIEERTRLFEPHRQRFNGIHRFLVEDRAGLEAGRSASQLRKECKRLAYDVILRSDAWGRLLSDCFPAALRLSIHPQGPHSEKVGILLGDAGDAWLTPWHAVALEENGRFRLEKRRDAEALGARLVEEKGRPSHFTRDVHLAAAREAMS